MRFDRWLAGVAIVAAAAWTVGEAREARVPLRDRWSAAELELLASMQLSAAATPPADSSNRYERDPAAAALGKALFDDARLSRDGSVACASCHDAGKQFQDGRPVGQGVGTGRRRTMPVMGAAHSPFLFWDGRKDSLWSQALGPLEDAAEHGGNRVRLVRTVRAHYEKPFAAVFGAWPSLDGLPDDASPTGTPQERAAWSAMPERTRDGVNRLFADIGKAIAAYERQVAYEPSRFDRYVEATVGGDGRAQEVLSPQEARGLRVFLDHGQCASCHNGPMLTDHAFHNTGVPPAIAGSPDRGRADAVAKLLNDEFNCLGPYSDARPEQCGELRFLQTDDPNHLGAFRTPSLRNVALRPPYMHAGQLATLEDVVRHYARSPRAAIGHSELARPGEKHAERQPIRLTDHDVEDLVAFLSTLGGPIAQPRP